MKRPRSHGEHAGGFYKLTVFPSDAADMVEALGFYRPGGNRPQKVLVSVTKAVALSGLDVKIWPCALGVPVV